MFTQAKDPKARMPSVRAVRIDAAVSERHRGIALVICGFKHVWSFVSISEACHWLFVGRSTAVCSLIVQTKPVPQGPTTSLGHSIEPTHSKPPPGVSPAACPPCVLRL
jgi:hypothetical protein